MKDELCDVPEPELVEPLEPLEPDPVEPPHAATATVTIATSAMAPRTANRASRPSNFRSWLLPRILSVMWDRRIKRFLPGS